MKCFKCGKPGYTTRTCPNCSKARPNNRKPSDDNRKMPGRGNGNPKDQDRKSFAQIKEKPKIKKKKKPKVGENTTELGFAQIGTVERDPIIEYSFVNIGVVESPSKTPLKTETEPDELSEAEYTLGGSNNIGGEFTEYFTPNLVKEMKHNGLCDDDSLKFDVQRSALHVDTHLAQCLTCGGRGFMGLEC